jgi:Domain of Unknown Function (DUF1080)
MTNKPLVEMAHRSIQLFNGVNLDGWRQAGPGGFRIDSRMLVTEGGMGLLWYSARQFGNFELGVDWKVTKKSDNSGVFVRFPAPTVADEPGGDPQIAIDQGYEIQIDDDGAPDGEMFHKTGAIYGLQPPAKLASRQPGEWNTFVIRVEGHIYNVTLNGEPVIINFKGNRSLRGHIGLQNHSLEDRVFFRNIIATPF